MAAKQEQPNLTAAEVRELASSQHASRGVPFQGVEVDAARLLLLIYHFATPVHDALHELECWPQRAVIRYFTPEYKLQKLDFLVRYPDYLAYELVELHRLGIGSASSRDKVMADVRGILEAQEPDLRTNYYRKFFRGAYERIDVVETWWYSRHLVYSGVERRGAIGSPIRPQKYYFLTQAGEDLAKELIDQVDHARWYDERIRLLYEYFNELSAAQLMQLQYSHPSYRQAQLDQRIPELSPRDVQEQFERVFGELIGVPIE